MNRRDAVIALAALGAAPRATHAQQARKIPVIGWLNPGTAGAITGGSSAFDGLRAGLRAAGYIEGETISIEERWAHGKPDAPPGLAQELVQRKVEIIVAVAPPAVRAAAATRDLPIVAQDLDTDPVASGLVAGLAKPGGNSTGLFLNHADLAAKFSRAPNRATCRSNN